MFCFWLNGFSGQNHLAFFDTRNVKNKKPMLATKTNHLASEPDAITLTQDQPLLARLSNITDLTTSENTLSLYFERSYPQIAFENLEKISDTCQVSKATVTRFVRRLGYDDFRSFSRDLKDEVSQNFDSPIDRRARASKHSSETEEPCDILNTHFKLGQYNLQRTIDQLDEEVFAKVAHLVSDSTRPLFLLSAATGRMLLGYFYLLAKYQRSNIHLLAGTDRLAHDLLDASPNSVLLVTNFDRYPTSVLATMRYFREIGAETVLISNRRSSPLLRYANHALFVHTEADSVFKSRIPMLATLEALVSCMGTPNDQEHHTRFDHMEKLFRELGVYLNKDQT